MVKTKLNLGCGKNPLEGYINVDITPFPKVDALFNFDCFPYPFKDNSFDEIYLDNVLEHLDDVPKAIKELHRISAPNGNLIIKVPYYNSYGAYNDITHKHYFNSYSFEAFYKNEHRSNYGNTQLELISLELIPTRLGKLIPIKKIRLYLSFVVGQLIALIVIKLKVIKQF